MKIFKFYLVLIMSVICYNSYGIKDGLYKASFYCNRYCYVRNDTIWFNYSMPTGEGYIRFAKGVVEGNGQIRLLHINDKPKTVCDTVFIRKKKNVNQLMLNIYDVRTKKQFESQVSYHLHKDFLFDYEKRIFLERPFTYVDSCHILNYGNLKTQQAVLSFDSFYGQDIFETVFIKIRNNEQAMYRIVMVPIVVFLKNIKEFSYSNDETDSSFFLYFTKAIHGFPNIWDKYLPVENPDMPKSLEYVFNYYINRS